MTEERPGRSASLWIGVGLGVLACLILALRETAIPVVLDVPLVALGVAGLGLAAQLFSMRRSSGRRPGAVRVWLGAAALLATGTVAVLSFHQRFLTYRVEEVRFAGGSVVLAGSLHAPRSSGPHPAVAFVHGSGPETRREYEYFARAFAREGVVALAYDKRGTGRSDGELYDADYGDYAGDALAAVRFLRGRDGVDGRCVGLVGFSEGEWVAPLAASRSADVAFLVVVGASGVSPAQQVSAEIALRLRSRGYPAADVERALALNERVMEYQRTGEGVELEAELEAAASEPWFRDAEDIPERLFPPHEYRWWRSVMDFAPGPVWEDVDVPVLVLKGGRDAHSEAERARIEIESALRRGSNPNVEFLTFPAGDHMLLRWPLGEGVPPPVFASGYPDAMLSWVGDRACSGRPAHGGSDEG